MIEKSLIIIIAMYGLSFSLLGVQYTLADVFGITLTNWEGVEIKSTVLSMVDIDALNQNTLNVINTNETTIKTDPIIGAANITWELFQLLTGTYIFNILFLFSVPIVFVGGFVFIYVILLVRALIGYLRGV